MFLFLLLACGSNEESLQRHQLCFYGATEPFHGANPVIDAMCDGLPNLVRNVEADLPAFRIYEGDLAEEALIDVLDTDGDGQITDDDTAIVDVLGYSWGGASTTQLDLHALSTVTATRPLVGRMVTIDPFVPPQGEPFVIAGQVEEVWSYGHSVAPDWDCSLGAPFAPYRSRPIDCSSTDAPCTEYDLSRDREVGHCSIVTEVRSWALGNLLDGSRTAPEALAL